MDQVKIGRFIAEQRKKQKLTQFQLAKKLNITDRAISKWETGKSFPDVSLILDLCNILKIGVNDLLNGEVISMTNYEKKQEDLLLEVVKEKVEADKRLLKLEIYIGIFSVIILFGSIFIAAFAGMEDWVRLVVVILGCLLGFIGFLIALRIEQVAGYYECKECHHKYVPTYKAVFFAMHSGRTRKMNCPKCNKKTWQKKVLK